MPTPPLSLYFLMWLKDFSQTREPAVAIANLPPSAFNGPMGTSDTKIWGRRCPTYGEREQSPWGVRRWWWLMLVVVCVCVVSTSSRGGLPSDAVSTARRIHPPPMPATSYPPFRHPISLSLGRCQLTGVRWVTQMGQQLRISQGQFHGCLLASRPARHSVTPRCWLVLLSFSRLNLQAWKDSVDWFSHPNIEMEQRQQVSTLVGHSSGPNARTAWGKQTSPRAPRIFITLLLSHIVRMEEYRCYARTTPRRRSTQYAHECERQAQALATNSAFCRGFKPWAVCYFEHHSTTQPHVTCWLLCVVCVRCFVLWL